MIAVISNAQQIRDISSLKNSVLPPANAVEGDYFKDLNNNLDKFIGNWLYIQGVKRVELNITKINRHHFWGRSRGVFVDKLSVEFKYYENGILVKESTPGFFSDLDQIELFYLISNPIIGSNNLHDDGYSIINGAYKEPFNSFCSKPIPGDLWLSYKTQNNNVQGVVTIGKLYWERRTRYINSNLTVTPCADNFELPANMVFIKQP